MRINSANVKSPFLLWGAGLLLSSLIIGGFVYPAASRGDNEARDRRQNVSGAFGVEAKYLSDAGNTGRSSYSAAGNTGKLAFWKATPLALNSPPTVGKDGTMYAGSGYLDESHFKDYSTFYALDSDSKSKWEFKVPRTSVWSAPVVGSNGVVYFVANDGTFYALDATKGTPVWTNPLGIDPYGSPAVDATGTLYICDTTTMPDDGHLFALDGRTGKTKWVAHIGETETHCPTIGPDGTIYVIGSKGLLALRPDDGTVLWTWQDAGQSEAPLVDASNTLYLLAHGSVLTALDGKTGATKWTHKAPRFETVWSLSARGTLLASGLDKKGFQIVGAFDANDGHEKWRLTVQEPDVVARQNVTAPVCDTSGRAFFGLGKEFVCADSETGKVLWRSHFPSGHLSTVTAIGPNGQVYGAVTTRAGAAGGHFFALK